MSPTPRQDASRRFAACRSGATSMEYALVAAVVAVAIIGGLTAVQEGLNDWFTRTNNAVAAAGTR